MDRAEALIERRSAVLDVVAVAGVVALAAQARIPLPWTPVPITLQTVPVLAAGFVVGWRRATAGMLLYVALGLMGAHVFAVNTGVALTPTFGYILAFAAAPAAIARFRNPVSGVIAATALIYAVGATWLALTTPMTAGQIVASGVAPFIPGDVVKAYAACRIGQWARQ